MNQTPNYQLNQWDAEDKVQRVDFNADNAKIDGALKVQADTLAAHTTQLAKLGNCQIWTTSYRGTGTCGPDHPTSLTFPKKPVLALIENNSGKPTWLFPRNGYMYNSDLNYNNYLSWSGSTAKWYIDVPKGSVSDPFNQLNGARSEYRVIAFLAADQ